MFDVNASLIRFWESRFDVLKPKKNKKGNRLFTPADVKNLEIIYHLVKERGMTLAGAEKYLKANKKELERDTEIVKRLQNIRSLLVEIREELKEPVAGEKVIVHSEPEWEPEPVIVPEIVPVVEITPDPEEASEPEFEPILEPEPDFLTDEPLEDESSVVEESVSDPEPEIPVEEGFSDEADSFGLYEETEELMEQYPPEPEPEEEGEPLDAGVSEPFTAQPLFEVEETTAPSAEPEESGEGASQSAIDFNSIDTQQSLF